MSEAKVSRFLVVDEQDSNQLFFQMLLKDLGYTDVRTAKSGADGEQVLETANSQFVIVAWEMSIMSGTVFVQRIRSARKRRHMPFLIYSKRMTDQDAQLLNDLGLTNILTMPFDKQKAADLIKRLIEEEDTTDPVTRTLRRVEDLLDEKKPTEALTRMTGKVLQPGPHTPHAQTLLGEIWLQIGRHDKAEEALTVALHAKADHMPAMRMMAKIKSLRGQHGEALEILEKLAANSPKNLMTQLSLGSAYVKADRHEDAQKVFAQVGALDPDAAGLKDEQGQLALKTGNVTLAAQLLSQTQNGDEIAAYFNNLGIAYSAKGNLDQAIATYRNAMQVLSSRAKLHVLHYNLGLAQRKKGLTEEALNSFAESYALDFQFEKAYAAYVKLYKENPASPAAKATATRVKTARAMFTAKDKQGAA